LSKVSLVHAPLVHAEALVPGRRISLDRTHARGLRFRGINAKEAFTLVDKDGGFFRASLASLAEDGGEALVYERMLHSPESPAHITLICAVLARQRMLGVIQKATELGVVRVVPVFSERSVQQGGLAHEKAHAWPGQALRASRQCRRASVPEVRNAMRLTAALDDVTFKGASRRYYLDDRAGDRAAPERGEGPSTEVAFAVGPEGGWTDEERSLLDDRGAAALRFGGRVLRAETAVLVGIARLQQVYGDL
jgi:16S rRNA (uracil1498-N3)-methyltransferase